MWCLDDDIYLKFTFIFYNKRLKLRNIFYENIYFPSVQKNIYVDAFHTTMLFRSVCCAIRSVATFPITYFRLYVAGTTLQWSQIRDCTRQSVNIQFLWSTTRSPVEVLCYRVTSPLVLQTRLSNGVWQRASSQGSSHAHAYTNTLTHARTHTHTVLYN